MAQWMEALTKSGTDLIGTGGDVLGDVLRNEVTGGNGRNPDRPKDQPEKQYDTEVQYPDSGQSDAQAGPVEQMRSAVNEYKWYAAGALAVVAFIAWRGAR